MYSSERRRSIRGRSIRRRSIRGRSKAGRSKAGDRDRGSTIREEQEQGQGGDTSDRSFEVDIDSSSKKITLAILLRS